MFCCRYQGLSIKTIQFGRRLWWNQDWKETKHDVDGIYRWSSEKYLPWYVQDAHPPTSRRGFHHRVYKVLIVGGYDHTMFWGLSEDKILNSIPGSFQSLPHFPYSLIDLLSGTNPLFWSNLCGYVSMAQNSWPKNGWLSRQNNPFSLVDWYPMANNPGPHSHGQA